MIVYRIGIPPFINDLSGEGTRRLGSRWTTVGIPLVYTAENRSLAALEFYVHGKASSVLTLAKLVTIQIPDGVSILSIDIPHLPADWRGYPAPTALRNIGDAWIKSGEFLLKIPSVLVPHEFNYVLNVDHPDMKKVKVVSIEDFSYDPRMQG